MSSSPDIRRRTDRRVAASVTAFMLIALGALGIWWSVTALAEQQALPGAEGLSGLTWSEAPVLGLAAAMGLIGVVLVGLASIPGRVTATPLSLEHVGPRRTTVTTTAGLGRIAGSEAERVDGTVTVNASATARKVFVTVGSVAADTGRVKELLTERIQGRLTELQLSRTPKVVVKVHRRTTR